MTNEQAFFQAALEVREGETPEEAGAVVWILIDLLRDKNLSQFREFPTVLKVCELLDISPTPTNVQRYLRGGAYKPWKAKEKSDESDRQGIPHT